MVKMRRYTIKEEQIITTVKCNKCGREIYHDNHIIKEGVFTVDYQWGYFSDKDREVHSFDLCEECYDEFIKGFKIDVDIREENELL